MTHQGVAQTGRNRTINRQKLDRAALERQLAELSSLRHQVFSAYCRLLQARASEPAFHPYGNQRALRLRNNSVFAQLRTSLDGENWVLCLHNVSSQSQQVQFQPSEFDLPCSTWCDLLTGRTHRVGRRGLSVRLRPYAVRWLKARASAPG